MPHHKTWISTSNAVNPYSLILLIRHQSTSFLLHCSSTQPALHCNHSPCLPYRCTTVAPYRIFMQELSTSETVIVMPPFLTAGLELVNCLFHHTVNVLTICRVILFVHSNTGADFTAHGFVILRACVVCVEQFFVAHVAISHVDQIEVHHNCSVLSLSGLFRWVFPLSLSHKIINEI